MAPLGKMWIRQARQKWYNISLLFLNMPPDLTRMFAELKEELLFAVEQQIKVTVNGKIDGIKKDVADIKSHLEDQDKVLGNLGAKIEPFDEAKTFFANFKAGVMWFAGLLVPLGIIWGVIMGLYKLFTEV